MKTDAPWIKQADQAMQRAALRARKIAKQTNTSLHVFRDGIPEPAPIMLLALGLAFAAGFRRRKNG